MMIYLLIFILGTLIGSFLNVVICRLPEKRSIARGRSSCPHCKAQIKFYDLIPILSFFICRQKCRQCGKKISWQYPLVEFFTGLIFVFLAYKYDVAADWANVLFWRDLIFSSALIVIFTTDLRYFLIFNVVTIPMMVVSFGANLFLLSRSEDFLMAILNLSLAGIIAGGFFFAQYQLSRGKWIGAGDIKLGFLMGFMLGWPNILVALFIAYVGGAVISLLLLSLHKRNLKSEMPFGVFLSAATFVALVYGSRIIEWYLNFLSR
ncbi:prepilin peptidase [Patescibacteria group bacterium]|nr:prepilin peptidase [Patescibacteria group bacterium]